MDVFHFKGLLWRLNLIIASQTSPHTWALADWVSFSELCFQLLLAACTAFLTHAKGA